MSKSLPQEVTQLLLAWSSGDKTALDKLVPLVHAELHRLARQRLRQLNPEHLLQTTALVNEAYLRLIDCGNVEWRDRAHFFAIAAQLMREVLVDYTRRQHARKRGASAIRVSLDEAAATADSRSADLVALDDAMKSLAEIDLRKSRIIELRFFGGLNTPSSDSTALREMLEPVGGAAPLESRFYIARPVDEKFRAAIARHDSIVLVKGARQVGKTSLLARGLQQAREAGASVVLTDFQNLGSADLESFEKLLLSFADSFADQLDLDVSPGQLWKADRSPGINFEQFLRREALLKTSSQIIWGLDEVDRLFACDFGSEVFGLFRSWHNKRALDPAGQWRRLTLAIAYATEAHLFITDLNQSPFNVGTRLRLEDFSFEQVTELNTRYGSPLGAPAEVARFQRLVGGHPYLARRGLHEMVSEGIDLAALEARADHDEGPFGDHLRRILVSLTQDAALSEVVRGILQGRPCPTPESFYRLRSAGLMTLALAHPDADSAFIDRGDV